MNRLTRRPRALLLAGLALVVVAGSWWFFAQASDDRHGPPRAGAVDSGVGFVASVADRWSHARPLTVAQTEAVDVDSAPWVLARVAGRNVWIVSAVGSGSCDRSQGVYVDETAHRVLIGTYVRHLFGPGAACTADLRTSHLRVRLRSPLGDREVVHTVVNWGQEMASQIAY